MVMVKSRAWVYTSYIFVNIIVSPFPCSSKNDIPPPPTPTKFVGGSEYIKALFMYVSMYQRVNGRIGGVGVDLVSFGTHKS